MFFYISKEPQSNFPHNHKTKNFVISLDEGWCHDKDHYGNDLWYKGYLDDGKLSDLVREICQETEPMYMGNFCIIKVFDRGVAIHSDRLRSFPLWHDPQKGLTNLQNIGETYWSDSFIMLENDLTLIHSKFDAIGAIDSVLLTEDQALGQIDILMDSKIKSFLKSQDSPIKIFLSGGVDSAFVFSYIQKHTDNYEVVLHEHIDFDYFYLKNYEHLQQFWGYRQIHHWYTDTVLSSGAPGDEFSCRNPLTVDLLLRYHGTSFIDIMHDTKFLNSLNYKFFKNNYLKKISDRILTDSLTDLRSIIKKCCDHNINDWQHWHLGKTLTYTPLRDIEMFKLYARLEVDSLIEQLMNSAIQVKLIEKNNPKLLDILTPVKNFNAKQNLVHLLKQI